MGLAAGFVWAIGAVICHQQAARSFFIDGRQLPVCARCTGLYASGAIAFALWLVVRALRGRAPIPMTSHSAVRAMAVAALPTAITWTTAAIGMWDGTNITRALFAIPLGAAAGTIVAAVATKDLR
ncbi:MAG TPA: DUF2085 domain-containing protein [Vicinamibacterales bacterium]|nr:DUF2085 domain-containing protein [Vicinamibacterales bacterium]